jgi:hypothetical protein
VVCEKDNAIPVQGQVSQSSIPPLFFIGGFPMSWDWILFMGSEFQDMIPPVLETFKGIGADLLDKKTKDSMIAAAKEAAPSAFDVVARCQAGHCPFLSVPEWLAERLVESAK